MPDRADAARYLGLGGHAPDARTAALIDSCLAELDEHAPNLAVWRVFPIQSGNINGIPGADFSTLLPGCAQAVVLAATLGPQIDALLRAYGRTALSRAVVLDACANAAIGQVCDSLLQSLGQQQNKGGLFLTSPLYPGSDGLPLAIQRDILRLLQADKAIGLTVSDAGMLLPTKSLTAIAGISSTPQAACTHSCKQCSRSADCIYRKD